MRERLTKIVKESLVKNIDYTHRLAENITDDLIANGVIVPPCRVGSVVYRVSFAYKTIEMLNVDGFLCNRASWKAHCTRFLPSWVGNKKEHFYISFSLFGKTVFLTHEEAERALKGGAG